MLEKFKTAKQREINTLQELEKNGLLPQPLKQSRPGFKKALKAKGAGAIIAEYKRASPSLGDINLSASPQDVALGYAKAGAAAISVLTEEDYFKGSINYLFEMCGADFEGGLAHNLPLLRKDFIFHPLQVQMTAASPASAFLLIVRMLDAQSLDMLIALGKSLGLDCVTEVFDEADLKLAQAVGAEIIQVNNRDLDKLEIDLQRSHDLVQFKKQNELWISASGIKTPEDTAKLVKSGFDALLIGSSLMQNQNPETGLSLMQGIKNTK